MSCDTLAVKEVGRHEELQCNLGCNGELWDLGTAVGVAYLVVEIHTHLAQDMGAKRREEGREGGGREEGGREGRMEGEGRRGGGREGRRERGEEGGGGRRERGEGEGGGGGERGEGGGRGGREEGEGRRGGRGDRNGAML